MQVTQTDRFVHRTGILERDFEVLASLPLFSSMSRSGLEHMLVDAWVHDIERGHVLFIQGEPAERFYVVFDGWVKLFRETISGDESVIAVFTTGESFAEAAMFDKADYPVSAMTVEDSRLLVVPSSTFINRLREHSDYALDMMASMSRHLRTLVRQIEQLSAKSSTQRVAGFLVRLCPADAHSAVVSLPIEKSLIAGRLGMQPETFSRSLKKLQGLGVNNSRNEVEIHDVVALREYSEGNQRIRA